MTDLPRGAPVAPRAAGGAIPPVIDGRDIRLRRPDRADAGVLFSATHGGPVAEAVWTYMGYGPWTDAGAMAAWIETTIPSADPFWFAVEAGGRPVGMAAVMSRDVSHHRAEVGHIWYVPAAQRTTIATEAAYLMLRECFTTLACRRVEWKCDALNERSRLAALRLGFRFEGVFRSHMVVKGRNRDTAWYGMTEADWEEAAPALQGWLYETPRDPAGRPVRPLRSSGTAS